MIQPRDIANILQWWQDAGVDMLVDDVPRAWLERDKVRTAPAQVIDAAPKATALPETLDDLVQWMIQSADVPGGAPPAARVGPSGDRYAGFMALIDMPEMGDATAGWLLSGEAGGLFDNMLGALKLSRESIWLASLVPEHRPGALSDLTSEDRLAVIARHHVGLVAPKRLWIMGDTASRAILGMGVMEAKGRKHFFNHKGSTVAVVATYHPRFLLRRPDRKREVWEDMQRLIEEV